MKLYLVWNMTNYGIGYTFYGICDTYEKAEKLYKKACKAVGVNPETGCSDDLDCEDSVRISTVNFIK
ncbi:MAG: hypothetical protein J6R32_00270 [Bacteroidales bacterium]|nr:hypothetical protein [Bacteroidales bacterium]